MKTILSILLVIIFAPTFLNASDAIGEGPFPDKRYMIKFFPSDIIMPRKTVRLGLEIPIAKKISFELDFGIVYSDLLVEPATSIDNSNFNFNLRSEFRHYFHTGWYLGPELYYRSLNYNSSQEACMNWVSGWFGPECTEEVHNEFKINRRELALLVKLGFQKMFDNNLSFDIFVGFGLKSISTDTPGKIGIPYPGRNSGIDSGFDLGKADSDKDTYVNAGVLTGTAGISIGYRFGKVKPF